MICESMKMKRILECEKAKESHVLSFKFCNIYIYIYIYIYFFFFLSIKPLSFESEKAAPLKDGRLKGLSFPIFYRLFFFFLISCSFSIFIYFFLFFEIAGFQLKDRKSAL